MCGGEGPDGLERDLIKLRGAQRAFPGSAVLWSLARDLAGLAVSVGLGLGLDGAGYSLAALAVVAMPVALSLVRVHYQVHDMLHWQWRPILANRSAKVLACVLGAVTGGSAAHPWCWNETEHLPHHIHTGVKAKDPDDYSFLRGLLTRDRLSSVVPALVFFLFMPLLVPVIYMLRVVTGPSAKDLQRRLGEDVPFFVMSTASMAGSMAIQTWLLLCHHRLWLLTNFWYIFAMALTQWFHHPHIKRLHKDDQSTPRQLRESRNTVGFIWRGDWPAGLELWMAGHQFQVEHHLYRTLSRHLYADMNTAVKQLCRKHGIVLKEVTVLEACKEVWYYMRGIDYYVTNEF